MRDLSTLPKVELHVHLDGSLRPETKLELARQARVALPSTDPEELRRFAARLRHFSTEVMAQMQTVQRQLAALGATWRDGSTPVNVSGGLESKGHPIAATGIANIWEVCHHLRGEAGDRQIEGAKVGLAHVIGLGSACGVHILEKSSL